MLHRLYTGCPELRPASANPSPSVPDRATGRPELGGQPRPVPLVVSLYWPRPVAWAARARRPYRARPGLVSTCSWHRIAAGSACIFCATWPLAPWVRGCRARVRVRASSRLGLKVRGRIRLRLRLRVRVRTR
eukprot:scaffold60390_cov54-Phaeocystis_antarctica.AAC.1